MKKQAIPVALCAWLIAAAALAAPFEPKAVPKGSSWVVHVDFDRLRKTQIGENIIQRTSTGTTAARMEVLKNLFKVDPRKDFHSLTLSGIEKGEENGVLVLRTEYDKAAIMALLQAGPAYQVAKYGTWDLHRFQDEKKQKMIWGAFFDEKTVVCGQNQERVGECLETLAGTRPHADPALWGDAPAENVVLAASADLTRLGQLDPKAAMLRQAEKIAITADETDGTVKCRIVLAAATPEVATQLNQVALGLVAMGNLAAANDPANGWLADLCQKVKVTQAGKTVQVVLDYPVANALAVMEAHDKARAAGAPAPAK